MTAISGNMAALTGCVGLAIGALTLIINILFAMGVYDVANRANVRPRLQFVDPIWWALATLFGGVFVATAFWVVHLSNLAPAGDNLPSDESPTGENRA